MSGHQESTVAKLRETARPLTQKALDIHPDYVNAWLRLAGICELEKRDFSGLLVVGAAHTGTLEKILLLRLI